MPHSLSRKLCRPLIGQNFNVGGDDYRIGGKIGDGAVGIVRKATRVRDNRVQAIKFLAPDPKYIEEAAFDDVAARFTREGERGSKLESPFLLKVHKYVLNKDGEAFSDRSLKNPFIMMELVGGKTLERYIRGLGQQLTQAIDVNPQKLDLALQVVEGLEYLHKKKLVHRDVKPANIFLTTQTLAGVQARSCARLGDFGIVKWGDFHASLTTGALTATSQRGLGTMKYMSPEQAVAPKNVGVRSDIYSLGITLFELFAGRILASPHHVFEIMSARLVRGTTVGRYSSMGYKLDLGHQDLGELILDMHLRGIQGRPTVDRVRGILRRSYERMTGTEWRAPH